MGPKTSRPVTAWQALADAAQRERVSINELCSQIEAAKPSALSLTAAIRLWLFNYFRRRSEHARRVDERLEL